VPDLQLPSAPAVQCLCTLVGTVIVNNGCVNYLPMFVTRDTGCHQQSRPLTEEVPGSVAAHSVVLSLMVTLF